jgi:hypothetical protein
VNGPIGAADPEKPTTGYDVIAMSPSERTSDRPASQVLSPRIFSPLRVHVFPDKFKPWRHAFFDAIQFLQKMKKMPLTNKGMLVYRHT